MKKALVSFAAGLVTLGAPLGAAAYGYSVPNYYGWVGTQHAFSPYTYVNVGPYINTSPYASAAAAAYPMQTSSYMYSNQQMYGYSYPQYQNSYPSNYYQSEYYQPTYQSSYYDYSMNRPYTPRYQSPTGDYCYAGYGCYPLYVEDPHQWIYDSWTGTWY